MHATYTKQSGPLPTLSVWPVRILLNILFPFVVEITYIIYPIFFVWYHGCGQNCIINISCPYYFFYSLLYFCLHKKYCFSFNHLFRIVRSFVYECVQFSSSETATTIKYRKTISCCYRRREGCSKFEFKPVHFLKND